MENINDENTEDDNNQDDHIANADETAFAADETAFAADETAFAADEAVSFDDTDVIGDDIDPIGEGSDLIGDDTDPFGEGAAAFGDETLDLGDSKQDSVPGSANDRSEPYTPPAPPYTPPAPPYTPPGPSPYLEDRLVRDPNASFAGVLSGIAHRYGWDVSLTRLAFIAFTLATGGGIILLYLLAWLIVPRANYWPPMTRTRVRSLQARDLGFALLGLAVFVVLAAGTGEAAAVIVPLGLIVGGVWLLVQNPRDEVSLAGAPAGPIGAERSTFSDSPTGATNQPWTTPQMPPVAQQPVPPRSRSRRVVTFGVVGLVLLIPVLIIGAIIAAVVFAGGDFNINETTAVTPLVVEDIPRNFSDDAGEYILDLTNVDFSDVEEPVEVSVSLDFGRIEVRVDDDVRVEVDALVDGLGSAEVFGDSDSGIEPSAQSTVDDPQLILDLDLDVGEIEIVRFE